MLHRLYILTDPRGSQRAYIGQTCKPVKVRYRQHVLAARSGHQYPVYRWMRKLASEGVTPSLCVFRTCGTKAEANAAEVEAIAVAREGGVGLLNITAGGGGVVGIPRDICAAKMRAKWADPEYKARVGAAISATYSTPRKRAEQSARGKESNARPEVKAKVDAARRRAWDDPEARSRRVASMRATLATPEAKVQRSAEAARRWADPEYKARVGRRISEATRGQIRRTITHGTYAEYKSGCKCVPCRAANAAYTRRARKAG